MINSKSKLLNEIKGKGLQGILPSAVTPTAKTGHTSLLDWVTRRNLQVPWLIIMMKLKLNFLSLLGRFPGVKNFRYQKIQNKNFRLPSFRMRVYNIVLLVLLLLMVVQV